jgi:hypothetical protein
MFWDHETDELTTLADSWEVFENGCKEPESIALDESNVVSAWIDPEFAKQLGIVAPKDGWKKRP